MAHGGKREGAGRGKGSKNKATIEVQDKLKELGCDPIEALARVAMEAEEYALSAGPEERTANLQIATSCYKELAQYIAPKRKAIEHTGEVTANIITFEDADSL